MDNENKNVENTAETAEKFEQEEQPETDGSDGVVSDPALYLKVSVPYDNVEIATEKGNEFYKEVCALREKYNVPELVIAFEVNAKTTTFFGVPAVIAIPLVGYRGGASRDNLIIRLVKQTRFGSLLIRMTKEESLHIILHSEEWYHELFLPFTRYVNGKKEYAFLVGNSQINFEVLGHHKPTLYVGNMFDLSDLFPQLKQMQQASYESFDAMLNDGWEID